MPKPPNCSRAEPEFSTNHSYPASKPSCQDSECPITPSHRFGSTALLCIRLPARAGFGLPIFGYRSRPGKGPCLGGVALFLGGALRRGVEQESAPRWRGSQEK